MRFEIVDGDTHVTSLETDGIFEARALVTALMGSKALESDVIITVVNKVKKE